MITYDDIVDLLSLAAVYDQRNAGEVDIRGWHAVAQLERWTASAAQRVVIEHYSRGAEKPRITPAAISDGIRAARRKAAATFVEPDVPDGIAGRDYPAWYRAQMAAHVDRVLADWAAGEEIPEPTTTLEAHRVRRVLTAGPDLGGCPEELREQFARDLSRAGREPVETVIPVRLPRLPASDPDRQAAARAELEALKNARGDQGETGDVA